MVNCIVEDECGKTDLLNVLGYTIKYEYMKPAKCIILKSKSNGNGKNTFTHIFKYMYYNHFSDNSSLDAITGQFNAHALSNVKICIINEATTMEKYGASLNKFKTIITEEFIVMNEKNVKEWTEKTNMLFFITSNYDEPIKLEPTDRRFLVYDMKKLPDEVIRYLYGCKRNPDLTIEENYISFANSIHRYFKDSDYGNDFVRDLRLSVGRRNLMKLNFDLPEEFTNKIYLHKYVPFVVVNKCIKNLNYFTEPRKHKSTNYYYEYSSNGCELRYHLDKKSSIYCYLISDVLTQIYKEEYDEAMSYMNYLENTNTDYHNDLELKYCDKDALNSYYKYLQEHSKKNKEKEKRVNSCNRENERVEAVYKMFDDNVIDEKKFKELIGNRIVLRNYSIANFTRYLKNYNMTDYNIIAKNKVIEKRVVERSE
jgi:hypothetical protein